MAETPPNATAVCADCGHTWTPKNTATTGTHRRTCSKCKSANITLKFAADATDNPDTEKTPEPEKIEQTPVQKDAKPKTQPCNSKPGPAELKELLKEINTPPGAKDPKTPAGPQDDADAETDKTNTAPSLKLIAIFGTLAALGMVAGAFWFLRRRQNVGPRNPPTIPATQNRAIPQHNDIARISGI